MPPKNTKFDVLNLRVKLIVGALEMYDIDYIVVEKHNKVTIVYEDAESKKELVIGLNDKEDDFQATIRAFYKSI